MNLLNRSGMGGNGGGRGKVLVWIGNEDTDDSDLVDGHVLNCPYSRLDLFSTEEGPESEDNTYLGYSLALGHFDGEGGSGVVLEVRGGIDLKQSPNLRYSDQAAAAIPVLKSM